MLIVVALVQVFALGSALADRDSHRGKRHVGFVEAGGAFGFQLGVQPYLPDGSPNQFQHPLTTSFSASGTAGFEFLRNLAVILNYEFADVSSRKGDVPGVLDRVEGSINYHTLVLGVRAYRRLGAGSLVFQFGAGIVFPFETKLAQDYGPALAQLPQPITGTGEQISEYGLGVGAHGQIGYELPIVAGLYLGASLRVHSFQANNNGKERELDNFVVDFDAPQPVNLVIEFDDDGGPPPENYSVQAIRLHLNLGYRF